MLKHPKISTKLFKAIRQAEKVSQVSCTDKNPTSSFYSKTKK